MPNETWQADFTPYRLRRPDGRPAQHGIPAATLTDNGMVSPPGSPKARRGAGTRNGFETELPRLGIEQKNSTPGRPTTCGNVERFQQTMKKCCVGNPHSRPP